MGKRAAQPPWDQSTFRAEPLPGGAALHVVSKYPRRRGLEWGGGQNNEFSNADYRAAFLKPQSEVKNSLNKFKNFLENNLNNFFGRQTDRCCDNFKMQNSAYRITIEKCLEYLTTVQGTSECCYLSRLKTIRIDLNKTTTIPGTDSAVFLDIHNFINAKK